MVSFIAWATTGVENGRKPLIDNVCGHNGTQNSKENKDNIYYQQEVIVIRKKF